MSQRSDMQQVIDSERGRADRLAAILNDLAVIYPAIKHTRPNPEYTQGNGSYFTRWWADADYPWRAVEIHRLALAISAEADKAEIDELKKEFRG